jgi:hypothetical protein
MAWRPYENLIEGELDNTTPGRVVGWIRFFRRRKQPLRVRLELAGDFLEDIRGKKIRLFNPTPSDRNETLDRRRSYMDGMAEEQMGEVGDITAGLPINRAYPYVNYPYIEWYSELNGRVVLELNPSQVAVVEPPQA